MRENSPSPPPTRAGRSSGLCYRGAVWLTDQHRAADVCYWHKADIKRTSQCPLLGVKRTCRLHCVMSANDPKRTSPCTGSEAGFSPIKALV